MHIKSFIAAGLGVIAHVSFFIRGEWHVQAPHVFRFYMALFGLMTIFTNTKLDKDVLRSSSTALHILIWHLFGLFGSIIVYRVCFHPLRRFRGPFLAKFSKLWHVWRCRTSTNHLFLDSLRQKYGDFVRTGPNEITVFHPDGLATINKVEDMARSQWYDLVHPSYSINTVRDQTLHDMRRKVWEPAFTSAAMRGYEHRIRKYAVDVLMSVRKPACSSVDMTLLIYRFAYSVMSDLAFGQELDDSHTEWQRAVRTMHTGLSILGPLSPAPWVALLFFSFTWLPLVRDWNSMMAFCRATMSERIAMSPPPKNRDIAAWLIEDAQRRGHLGTAEEKRWLDGDAFSVILAGSDTTASTLVFAIYYLAKNPEYQQRIRQELPSLHTIYNRSSHSEAAREDAYLAGFDFKDFERLPFLNAFINETLRLHHPLPTAGSRIVHNPRGISIGVQHIPPGTNITAPRWSYGRCEAHYGRPHEFLPDRWLPGTTKQELVSDRRVFTPWLGGKWACLGKPIALFEMRYLISVLVKNFRISLPEKDNGDAVERDYKDQVTAFPGRLKLVYEALD